MHDFNEKNKIIEENSLPSLPLELVDKIAGVQPQQKRRFVFNLPLPGNDGNGFGKIKISLKNLRKDLKFLTKK